MKLNIIYAIMLSGVMAFVSCDRENPVIEPVKYSITLTNDGNGTATATVDGAPVTDAEAGATITLTTTPNAEYEFMQWSVTAGGEELITTSAVSPVTFVMPATNVSIKALFVTDNILTLITDPAFKEFALERMDEPQY